MTVRLIWADGDLNELWVPFWEPLGYGLTQITVTCMDGSGETRDFDLISRDPDGVPVYREVAP